MGPKRISAQEYRAAAAAKAVEEDAARARAAQADTRGDDGDPPSAPKHDEDATMHSGDDDDDALAPPEAKTAATSNVTETTEGGNPPPSPSLSTMVDYEEDSVDEGRPSPNGIESGPRRTPSFDTSSSILTVHSYSPPYSLASPKEEGEAEDTRHHDQPDRGKAVLVTNATQATEDRTAQSLEGEYLPWLPSEATLRRWSGAKEANRVHVLFDCVPIQNDPYLAGMYRDIISRQRFLVNCFFQHRCFKGHGRPTDRDIPALIQGWNQFLENVQRRGLKDWLLQLKVTRTKFEEHSVFGARMHVHRLSRREGYPCFVWGDACPQCYADAKFVTRKAFFEEGWGQRVSRHLHEAIDSLDRIYCRRRQNAESASGHRAAAGAPRRTERRGQAHPREGWTAAPNYPPKADNRAIERDTSFEFHSADRYASAGVRQSSALHHWNQSAVAVAVGTPRSTHHDDQPRRDDAELLRLQVAHERLRADLAEEKALRVQLASTLDSVRRSNNQLRSELDTLVRDYKVLLGNLERAGIQISRKRPRTGGTRGADQHKT